MKELTRYHTASPILGIQYDKTGKPSVTDAFMNKLPNDFLYMTDYIFGRVSWGFFDYLQQRDKIARDVPGIKPEFPYIAYDQDTFKDLMVKAMPGAKSFIDIGCGGGDKLAIVKHNWPDVTVHGIEHDPCMAIWAGLHADKVFCCDALAFNYRDYDVLYAYYPIANGKLMQKLVDKVFREKKKSAKFVLVGFADQKHRNWEGCANGRQPPC